MKKIKSVLVSVLLAYSTLYSLPGLADGPGGPGGPWHHPGRGPDGFGPPGLRREGLPGPGGPPPPDARRDYDHDRFAWEGHEFRRGRPVPREYCGDRYRIDDWRERGLREPPEGQHWADIDGNYVLIAAATGIITSLILNNAFH
ncbi:RcnB family protein [Pantoea stewartii]|uniref:RcnB family protein n=1 Tax=Pantoea stewartii TaxID=66269 RepID=UPI0021D4A94A|nr:RcnB family protein [Pantoea stewartii]MCU7368465.1 RcnB family protein [Pantoea stewartii]